PRGTNPCPSVAEAAAPRWRLRPGRRATAREAAAAWREGTGQHGSRPAAALPDAAAIAPLPFGQAPPRSPVLHRRRRGRSRGARPPCRGGLGRAPPGPRRRHTGSGAAAWGSAGHCGVRAGQLLEVRAGVRVPSRRHTHVGYAGVSKANPEYPQPRRPRRVRKYAYWEKIRPWHSNHMFSVHTPPLVKHWNEDVAVQRDIYDISYGRSSITKVVDDLRKEHTIDQLQNDMITPTSMVDSEECKDTPKRCTYLKKSMAHVLKNDNNLVRCLEPVFNKHDDASKSGTLAGRAKKEDSTARSSAMVSEKKKKKELLVSVIFGLSLSLVHRLVPS
ncbi:unnamed protein product, partial [Urochloa humidicola]